MPRITLCGYASENVQGMVGRIEKVLAEAGLGHAVDIHIDRYSDVYSGDGKRTLRPFLQLFTAGIDPIEDILEQMFRCGVHERLEITGVVTLGIDSSHFEKGTWIERWQDYCRRHHIV